MSQITSATSIPPLDNPAMTGVSLAVVESDRIVHLGSNLVDRNTSHQPTVPAHRIHYFDWLRALAVFGVVAYHALLPFARDTWSIANDQQSATLLALLYVLESFGLAILFLIAGAGVRFALQRRTMRMFLAERGKRLLVPFVVGTLVVVPATSYIIVLHLGTFSGPFLAFLAVFPRNVWANIVANVGLSPEILTYVGMHLWFLAWLFICSALALPIFALLSSSAGRTFVDLLGRLVRWRGVVLLLGVPLAVPRIILSGLPPAYSGWSLEAFVWYGIVFVVGYVLYSDDRMIAAVRRDLWLALVVAVLGSYAFMSPGFVWRMLPQTYGSFPFWMGLMGITGWAWTLTILGVGIRAGFMQRPLPPLASEAALPAYVLHFPIVIGISALVVEWSLGFGAKILINALLGVGVTLLVVFAALRFPLLRPLLGLRRPLRAATGGVDRERVWAG